ncbi:MULTISPECIES: gliding motility-associated C-terminal domain-containing protein [unclassified Myroides]|uniref:gliding motility-associated C-terminal domain-containing protein n=1 Tax=unclassified Myroides TaxID=2642485 RepID=UPI003D2F9223
MNYTRSILFLFLLVLWADFAQGQTNHVLNPSFEIVNEASLLCNYYQSAQSFNEAITDWTAPTGGTPDIYHMSLDNRCILHPLSVSNSNLGNRSPRTGDSMVGLLLYSPNAKREYIQGTLSEPLQAGHRYVIRFYASLARKSRFASNNFGVKFYNTPLNQRSNDVIDVTPDANYTELVTQRYGWVLVSLSFTPEHSGATYFVIGNFFDDEHTSTVEDSTAEDQEIRAYYYIDDVEVYSQTPTFEPVAAICKGADFQLPEKSKEGYTGSWSPALNNQQTTTYVFTPDDALADTATLTVEVLEPYIEPLFTFPLRICEGTPITLPTQADNGYTGTWSPKPNTSETTTYTFTPEPGHCVLAKTITIEVSQKIQPIFELPSFVCNGTVFELPVVSNNGIEGTWSPAVDLKKTTTYTFTPLEQYCALTLSKTVEVKQAKKPRLDYYCLKNKLYVEADQASYSSSSSFQWFINQNEVGEDTPRLDVSNYRHLLGEKDNVIELTVRDEQGCSESATLTLYDAQSLCFIPRGISPQGDKFNDFFDLEHFGGVYLQLFNRYGVRVYSKSNYTNEWEGQTDRGSLLPSGTYFYQFHTVKGEEFTGWVQLMREF